jgi:hypothetical protein
MAWRKRGKKKRGAGDSTVASSASDRGAKKSNKKPRPVRPKPTAAVERQAYRHTTEEDLPEGAEILRFTIPGRTITKKTHQQIVRIGKMNKIIPSDGYVDYENSCSKFMRPAWVEKGRPPMNFGVGVRLKIYLENWASLPDHTGVMQSIGDILEHHGVIDNDKWIHWISGDDGHWFEVDPVGGSRCEIVIERRRHPYETYRKNKCEAEAAKEQRRLDRERKKANSSNEKN